MFTNLSSQLQSQLAAVGGDLKYHITLLDLIELCFYKGMKRRKKKKNNPLIFFLCSFLLTSNIRLSDCVKKSVFSTNEERRNINFSSIDISLTIFLQAIQQSTIAIAIFEFFPHKNKTFIQKDTITQFQQKASLQLVGHFFLKRLVLQTFYIFQCINSVIILCLSV